jgi:tyrosinase
MHVRKNASQLSRAERQAFVDAVLEVKHKPSRLHPGDSDRSRYDDFVQVHLDAMMVMMHEPPQPSWGHQAAAFGPWHRVLLFEFEKELQAVTPTVTLPYWDWTVDSSPTSDLWDSSFLGGNGAGADGRVVDGPFAQSAGQWVIRVKDDEREPDFLRREVAAAPDAQQLPTAVAQNRILGLSTYDLAPWEDSLRDQQAADEWTAFRVHLEIVLHNLVHRWVGGNMVAMTSPNDPVFWLHHANCDRLWSLWQRQHPGPAGYAPPNGGPEGHNLDDPMIFHEAGHHGGGGTAPWSTVYRPTDVLDSQQQLDVRYDTEPEAPLPVPPPAPSPPVDRAPPPPAAPRRVRRELPMFVLPGEIDAMKDQ